MCILVLAFSWLRSFPDWIQVHGERGLLSDFKLRNGESGQKGIVVQKNLNEKTITTNKYWRAQIRPIILELGNIWWPLELTVQSLFSAAHWILINKGRRPSTAASAMALTWGRSSGLCSAARWWRYSQWQSDKWTKLKENGSISNDRMRTKDELGKSYHSSKWY